MIHEFELVVDLAKSNTIEPEGSINLNSSSIALNSSGSLIPFIGECSLINLANQSDDKEINADEIEEKLLKITKEIEEIVAKYQSRIVRPKRLLVKTRTDQSETKFRHFSKDALHYFAQTDLELIGIDKKSLTENGLESDIRELGNLSILANLNLENIEEGYLYKLLAQPMMITPGKPVPVRPILLG